jgi:predicted Holliday junction resolvase-like endonuclease
LQIAPSAARGRSIDVVSELTLIIVAALALLALLRTAVSFARYRAVFRYAQEDLEEARRDAARRSRGVRAGRAAEQLAPLAPAFADRFDPADARFLGAPVDFVVFDGLAAGRLEEIVLVEVKTGSGRLNGNERLVRAAVAEGRVGYELLRL